MADYLHGSYPHNRLVPEYHNHQCQSSLVENSKAPLFIILKSLLHIEINSPDMDPENLLGLLELLKLTVTSNCE